ncbi:group 1 truncated hemoglobin [Phenylobacterium sp. LH3H17]|uniref:group I truncated hemoglobin n=1 Tax=Phenylobacterium sp. LH3H17 TaxID=2903901 RepID=UPI0020C9BAF1|nr:group 1 truncated hemoglobin [Phenylobacterium sp. LH3H17]UTP40276.1 group 1 truncated hemoglobin [Phenylobacterium sp. LH3H17]
MTIRALIVCLSLAAATPVVAQEETPVDPYVQSNANAGAAPFAGDAVLAAFHGREGVGRIVDDLVDRSIADPRIAEIFKATDLVRLRRTLKEQIAYLLGAPVDYTGRDMRSVHRDQGVNTAEFNALVENLQAAMDKEGVPFRAQNRLLAKLAPMKRDVVVR